MRLAAAATFFAVAVLIHNSDHTRRGADSVNLDVFWIGTSAILLEVGLVVLGLMRHRLAPLAASVGGFSLAAGYVVTHFLPEHGLLSDSFVCASDVSPMSWFAASLEVTAAITLGVVGLIVLRERGGLAAATETHDDQLPLRAGLLHPVTVAMIIGNAAILVISFAQLS
jgi:hypothetical protein